MKYIAVLLSVLLSAGLGVSECTACSTALLKHNSVLLLGHNLDELTDFAGFLCVNKRDVFKIGCTWEELHSSKEGYVPTLSWISVYGSVTFSGIGRDLPDAGINEAGLAIEEMSLASGAYPLRDIRPKLFQMQWIQYHLDNFRTVEEVVRSASLVVPNGWPWHFFVADKNGDCATIEYIDGRLVVHAGQTMPVTALCNGSYDSELEDLKRYEGFGGRRSVSLNGGKAPRFVCAARMLADYQPQFHPSPVDYCFSILKNLSSELTRRSYVVDISKGVVYFRTCSVPQTRHIRMDSLDFASSTPVRVLDLNVGGTGDVTGRFEDYTLDANRKIADSWVRHVQQMYPKATEQERLAGGYALTQIERYARYPESAIARYDPTGKRDHPALGPLYWAAYRGELETVAALVSAGADLDERTPTGATALMAAAQTGQLPIVKFLMEQRANLNSGDNSSALTSALVFGHPDVAQALVEAGAAIDQRDSGGLTPLFWAACQGDLKVTRLLVSHGADVKATAKYGYTPLMAAAQGGHAPVIAHLLDSGAEIDAVGGDGRTALFLAVANADAGTARCLIDRAAAVDVKDKRGLTPWEVARSNKDGQMMKLLKNAGAKGSNRLFDWLSGR